MAPATKWPSSHVQNSATKKRRSSCAVVEIDTCSGDDDEVARDFEDSESNDSSESTCDENSGKTEAKWWYQLNVFKSPAVTRQLAPRMDVYEEGLRRLMKTPRAMAKEQRKLLKKVQHEMTVTMHSAANRTLHLKPELADDADQFFLKL
ncbi:hypothetical protein L915_09910 [Phytophthora nicotianae]|uniref:Uncharacterized protein n=1 Tax=Phytophthora nicotianae TaxID=4792 RepID=W2IX03_PHYNI|nr:hypothetical protein L915_09910 [Phytophthora nicotianae]ETL38631.1 hypothetical protein L916_09820 [Phytophthora nicotianae]